MSCNEIGQPPIDSKIVTISQGDDYGFALVFKIAGVVVDLTGYTFDARIKKTGQTDVVLDVNTTQLASGRVTFTLSDTASSGMVASAIGNMAGRWRLDVVGTDPAGNKRRYLRVPFHVLN